MTISGVNVKAKKEVLGSFNLPVASLPLDDMAPLEVCVTHAGCLIHLIHFS